MAEERHLPRIGDPAPDFSAPATHCTDFNFSAWQGQEWVVLFSHPADFTPVCTTELIAFARQFDRFRQRGIKVIGVSVDSIHAHLAWLENIKEKMGIVIPFPLIADMKMEISRMYGMIHPESSSTATVRAVFVIDPKRIIRALVYYPMNAGRNVDEIFRLVIALQTADRFTGATPANWQEGEPLLEPPPQTVTDVEERLTQTDRGAKEFYMTLKNIPQPSADPPHQG